ncbi:MAG: amidase [Candidatus Binatota bacterium]|nr:amidase [Candidatus Binatota bacterium]
MQRLYAVARAALGPRTLSLVLATAAATSLVMIPESAAAAPFELVEATVADVHAAFAGKKLLPDGTRLTCERLVSMYFARINAIDDTPQSGGRPIRAVLHLNEAALAEARALDRLYAKEGIGKRPLHCIPMLLKDNYDTFDHPSTSGSYSMLGHQSSIDANSVAGLRRAGVLILGKANQDEFAFSVSGSSGRGIQTSNPYDTSQSPGGSSSGTGAAIASNFALIGTGTDTCMSIRFPSSVNGLVGIRSSVGLVSQHGVFPLTHARDVPGPMGHTVHDVVLALNAMAGADPRDPKTLEYRHPVYTQRPKDYTAFLDRARFGLKGKKIGLVTHFGTLDSLGSGEHVDLIRAAIAKMKAMGATVYEVELPKFESVSAGAMHYEWNEYFREFEHENGYSAPRRCLTSHNPGDRPCVGFDGILETLLVGPQNAASAYSPALTADPNQKPDPARLKKVVEVRSYVEKTMDAFPIGGGKTVRLDALLLRPGSSPRTCDFGSTTQMPSMVVPIGFTTDGVPKGVEILARKWDEPTIIGLGYDYEQATHHRAPPELTANPAAETAAVAEFNRARRELLQAAFSEDPHRLPAEAYAEILQDYFGVDLPKP